MTSMNKNMKMDETNKSIVKFSLNLRTPFCTSTFTFFFFFLYKLELFKMKTLEKNNTTPLCI
jgi:hypothetical protein